MYHETMQHISFKLESTNELYELCVEFPKKGTLLLKQYVNDI